jgi:hypothetical protein
VAGRRNHASSQPLPLAKIVRNVCERTEGSTVPHICYGGRIYLGFEIIDKFGVEETRYDVLPCPHCNPDEYRERGR